VELTGTGICLKICGLLITTTTTQYTTSVYLPFFQDNLGKPAPETQTILDFTGARDDGMVVALAGPYANHLQPAQTDYHASTSPLDF